MSPVRMFPPGHIRVTRSQEGSPSGDYILGALGLGEDQEVAGSTAHVMYKLLKCLLGTGKNTVTWGQSY